MIYLTDMKKYMPVLLFVALFITLLSFNANTVSAANCAPGDLFNTNTGQACVTTPTVVVGCAAGFSFSPITGQSCGIDSGRGDTGMGKDPISSSRILTIGSRGADVKSVQQILKNEGYSVGVIDGSYGKRTARVVREFQDDNDLAVTGTVNSDTWKVLKTFGVIVMPPPPIPDSPIISGVKGPQSLNVNEQGTWSVSAYDYSKGDNYLSYSVNWGDYSQGYAGISAQGIPFVQSSTFTHSYQNSGIYNPVFTVRNSNG